MMRSRGLSSLLSSATATTASGASKPNFVAKARKRRKRRRPQGNSRVIFIRVLCIVTLLFALYDVYYAVDLGYNKHQLRQVKPLIAKQAQKVKRVIQKEEQALEKVISNEGQRLVHLLHRSSSSNDDKSREESDADQQQQGNDDHAVDTAFLPDQEHEPTVKSNDGHEKSNSQGDKGKDEISSCDKEPLYEILRQAGVSKSDLSLEIRDALPCWSTVQRLYGTHPRIYGLDTCETFRSSIADSERFMGVAGLFNTGTNLLAELLLSNCQNQERMDKYGEDQRGVRWQVPYGKHTPLAFREQHVAPNDADVPLSHSLPLIAIRDPYRWMNSMCHIVYGARWNHNKTVCPHVYTEEAQVPSPVRVKYDDLYQNHQSLPGMWNDWYSGYMYRAKFPRVVVRFEDLLFYGKNVTQTLCQCGGGSPRFPKRFVHISASAKLGTAAHGMNRTNLLEALIRYGNDDFGGGRTKGFSKNDLIWSKKLLKPELMDIFNYPYA